MLNDRGELIFIGDPTPRPNSEEVEAVYLYSGGAIIPVARPGDAMPGGGPFVTLNGFIANTGLNRLGEATFSATLDTTDGRGVADQGLYVRTGGALQLVARTGTVVAGVGTIKRLITRMTESAGRASNDNGEVFFDAYLADGTNVLLVATPRL